MEARRGKETVTLYFQKVSVPNLEKPLQLALDRNRADTLISTSNGLRHYSQSDDHQKNFRDDVWIEKGETDSYTECGNVQSENTIPQCSHTLLENGIRFILSYDKKLLPEWKSIKKLTLSIFSIVLKARPLPQTTMKKLLPISLWETNMTQQISTTNLENIANITLSQFKQNYTNGNSSKLAHKSRHLKAPRA